MGDVVDTGVVIQDGSAPPTIDTSHEPGGGGEGPDTGDKDILDGGSEILEGEGAAPKNAESRIRQLVAQKKEAEEREAYWRGVAEGRSSRDAAPVPADPPPTPAADPLTPPTAPNIADFQELDAYEEAQQKYIVDMAVWRINQTREEERKREEVRKTDSRWMDKVSEAKTKYENFEKVITNPKFVQTPTLAFLIKDSEIGAELAYYLGTNLKECERLNQLPPHSMAKELGKLEAKLTAPVNPETRKTVSKAPDPITPVTPSGTPDVDEQNLSIDEFMKRRNEKEWAARRGI